jgi:hypothetical protein
MLKIKKSPPFIARPKSPSKRQNPRYPPPTQISLKRLAPSICRRRSELFSANRRSPYATTTSSSDNPLSPDKGVFFLAPYASVAPRHPSIGGFLVLAAILRFAL